MTTARGGHENGLCDKLKTVLLYVDVTERAGRHHLTATNVTGGAARHVMAAICGGGPARHCHRHRRIECA